MGSVTLVSRCKGQERRFIMIVSIVRLVIIIVRSTASILPHPVNQQKKGKPRKEETPPRRIKETYTSN